MEKFAFFVLQCIFREVAVVIVCHLYFIGFQKKYNTLVLKFTQYS